MVPYTGVGKYLIWLTITSLDADVRLLQMQNQARKTWNEHRAQSCRLTFRLYESQVVAFPSPLPQSDNQVMHGGPFIPNLFHRRNGNLAYSGVFDVPPLPQHLTLDPIPLTARAAHVINPIVLFIRSVGTLQTLYPVTHCCSPSLKSLVHHEGAKTFVQPRHCTSRHRHLRPRASKAAAGCRSERVRNSAPSM